MNKLIRFLATEIWLTSEWLRIPLGPAAPYIFGLMMGSRPKKIKKKDH